MVDAEVLKAMIHEAFALVNYPGDGCLTNSLEGVEPSLLAEEFKGLTDWKVLDAAFLDQAPDGYGSALSFFSKEALHFYLPAFLIADVDGLLERQDVVFQLTHGFTKESAGERVNPRRYDGWTWFDAAGEKFAMLNKMEAAAIVLYLQYKFESAPLECERTDIQESLHMYWLQRAE